MGWLSGDEKNKAHNEGQMRDSEVGDSLIEPYVSMVEAFAAAFRMDGKEFMDGYDEGLTKPREPTDDDGSAYESTTYEFDDDEVREALTRYIEQKLEEQEKEELLNGSHENSEEDQADDPADYLEGEDLVYYQLTGKTPRGEVHIVKTPHGSGGGFSLDL